MNKGFQTLGEFIIQNQKDFRYATGELARLINSIRLAAKTVNHEVNKAGLVDIIGAAGSQNNHGEHQQKLDVYADEIFIRALTNRQIVCGVASEENDDFISIKGDDDATENKYVVLIDPLDGSSNIDVNVSVGTIFSVYRRVTPTGTEVQLADFLQPGSAQVGSWLHYLWHLYHACIYHRSRSKWLYTQPRYWYLLSLPPTDYHPTSGQYLFHQ